jgi:NADH:ubiquinone reductase (H+-translocating)
MHTQRILIIGGGFAGVNAAVGAVDKLGSAQDRVSVELINPDPYWVIKPRLYERDLSGVRVPLDDVLAPLGVVRHETSVTAIDAAGRRVALDDGSTLSYDQLVLAAGSRLAMPERPGVHCVDSYAEAVQLRTAVIQLKGRKPRFRAVVVGGGFTGVELAAELAADAQVTLVAAGDVAPGFGPHARAEIRRALDSLGVAVRVGVAVDDVTGGTVRLSDGEWAGADLVAWAAGPVASDLTRQIPAERDRLGRLVVDAFLRTGVPGAWAAGDSACAKVDRANNAVMSCQHAGPQGRRAGENAAATVLGKRARRYRQALYLTCLALGDYGALLTCGFGRDTVLATRQDAAGVKRAINHRLIYPPEGEGRQAMLKIGKPAPPAGPAVAAMTQAALRSGWVRGKVLGTSPARSAACAAAEGNAIEAQA